MSSSIQFIELCSNGYLELAQKCYRNNPDINIYYSGNKAFSGACKNNHISVAKWFITILPYDADYVKYFNISLSYGRLDLMIYISNYIPDFDISHENHEIFYFASSYKYYHIIDWLHSIKPEVYSIDSDGIPRCYPEKDVIIYPVRPTKCQIIIQILLYIYIFIIIIIIYLIPLYPELSN